MIVWQLCLGRAEVCGGCASLLDDSLMHTEVPPELMQGLHLQSTLMLIVELMEDKESRHNKRMDILSIGHINRSLLYYNSSVAYLCYGDLYFM